MRRLLLKAGVPIAVGAMALASFSGVASANAKHPATSKPTFTLAYEGPLSGGNAQLGLNMSYSVQYAINRANSGHSQFGPLPFKLKYVQKDDQGSATISPTDAQELVADSSVIGVVGPAFSGATKAAEPTFSCQPPCDREPIGDPAGARATTDGRTSSESSRMTASRDRPMPTTSSKVLHKKDIYVANDASTYGVGLASAFAKQATQGRRDGDHRLVPRHHPVQRRNREPDAVPGGRRDRCEQEARQMLFYGGYYCDLGLLLGALHQRRLQGQGHEWRRQ